MISPMMSPIEQVREQIAEVDERLIAVLAERIALARAAARAKQAAGQPLVDPAREAAVVSRASALAREAGLPDDDVRDLYWRLMAMSRRVQFDSR